MTVIATEDAAGRLEELVRRAVTGEEIVIRDRTEAKVKLVPVGTPSPSRAMTLAELREFRKNITLGPGLTIKQLIEEGRR
jgi:antitoxin (DNA-binding transcriptional repressor) of toxin-antitoxin stability system